MNPTRRRAIYERFRAANPEPRGELEYASPFELLVAVILSAQATDKSVNRATRPLYQKANTPQALLKLGGQHAAYIVKALQAYKSGDRSHPSMRAIAAGLSDKDMADVAAYYSPPTWC